MQNDITMPELKKTIKKLKKENFSLHPLLCHSTFVLRCVVLLCWSLMLFSWLWFVSASSLAQGQKITLEDEGRTITGKAASKAFVKGYETESNTNIPLARKKRSKSRI
jgi:hypothetical protein